MLHMEEKTVLSTGLVKMFINEFSLPTFFYSTILSLEYNQYTFLVFIKIFSSQEMFGTVWVLFIL